MTNVNVLDLHMNPQATISRDSDEDANKKESRNENYSEW